MTCSAQFWSGGRKVWEVVHDAQDNVNHLESAGEPLPASLELYRAKAAASHATDVEVDFMFDVPLLLARDITGFKHDEKLEEGAALFRIDLVSEKASTGMTGGQKAWWKFW